MVETGWESLEIVSTCSKLSVILEMINNGWEWCAYVGNVREWYQVGNCGNACAMVGSGREWWELLRNNGEWWQHFRKWQGKGRTSWEVVGNSW